ncbi:MAG: DUF3047 domain-containing protein [Gammaproteobacteria bacterium]|jgi:hypothetical protein|nr:DUF3047 domain-containing protein [Gammaproteobacteria bacterium]MBU4280955.1 DUF3047 domain-containing protein [Gammaproteobacteria bacterium]MBU4507699.1 DUF3047 domain-containing protein [Gammaproteobacteria bacterium]
MNSHPASSHFFILQVSSRVDPNHSAAAATPHQGYSHAGWGIRAVRGLVALTLAVAGVAQAAPALPPLLLGEGALNPAWRFVGFPKKHADLPATRFEAGRVDGQAALKVVTASSYGTLVHDQKDVPPARLQWRWRLDQPLTGGKAPPDLLTKAGDDAALKVCVMFDHPLGRVPFVERTVLRIARSVSGEALPAATLCYVWDSGRPAPLQGANPYTRRVRFISLQGQGAPLGQWVNQSRDLAQDFSALFGDELPAGAEVPRVSTVLIGADSDNTASTSTGWVADLRWVDGRP